MASRKRGGLAGLLIPVLVLALLAALNPDREDFKAHLAARSARGVESKLLAGIASGTGALASGLYTRRDWILASTWTSPGEKGDVYLGLAKALFIKLR